MANTKKEEVKAKKPEEESSKKEEKKEDEVAMPPLEAAARRLERLLGGGVSDKDRMLHTYSNPSKVVKRWLGTSSGAAGDATLADISSAATNLLDPSGRCAAGRALILKAAGESMDTETTSDEPKYLSSASDREVEAWLISLAVRLLWKDEKFAQGFALSQEGITLLLAHIEGSRVVTGMGASVSSLFPLLARMYRYRSLNADSLAASDPSLAANLRQDMVRAHGMACLRRDVDTQATLLNLMLHDLLNASQSKLQYQNGFIEVLSRESVISLSTSICSRTSTKAPLEFILSRDCFQ